MSSSEITERLEHHDVRPTAVRLLVYRTMLEFTDTFSLADLEEALDTVDKSTIFRTLETFTEHHLVHEIEDGSGARKYCICHNEHLTGPDEDLHCHFYCESCQKTFCFDEIHIPPVKCPEGYETHQVEYIIKGICPNCRQNTSQNTR